MNFIKNIFQNKQSLFYRLMGLWLGLFLLIIRFITPPQYIEAFYSRFVFQGIRTLFDYTLALLPMPLLLIFYGIMVYFVVKLLIFLFSKKRPLRQRFTEGGLKTVKPIEIDALAEQINAASSKLYVYCFWNLKNDASVATVKALNTLTTKFDTTKLKIVYVNMPGYEKVEDVNLFIRENQLTEETLILEKADVSFFSKKIRKDMVGITTMPVVLMANKAEEILLFYNKGMDEKELLALVHPLVSN